MCEVGCRRHGSGYAEIDVVDPQKKWGDSVTRQRGTNWGREFLGSTIATVAARIG